jgi:drug/metabolite transporter (DMT)-like permease
MTASILIATIAGLGGMMGWGLADFFAKKTIDEIGDVVTLFWGHIVGTLCIIGIGIYIYSTSSYTITLPTEPLPWAILFLFGMFQAIIYLLVYRGFGKGQLALLNPVFASYSGVVALISLVVFGEVVTANVFVGLAILFLGIVLLNLDPQAIKLKKISFVHVPGFYEVFLAAIFAAIWTLGWDRFITNKDWLSYASVMYLSMSFTLLIYILVRRIGILRVSRNLWKYIFFIGAFETLAYVAISWGFATTPHTSVVALLSGAFSLPTIFLARVFLKEKTSRLQTIASVVIVIGIVLLFVV